MQHDLCLGMEVPEALTRKIPQDRNSFLKGRYLLDVVHNLIKLKLHVFPKHHGNLRQYFENKK